MAQRLNAKDLLFLTATMENLPLFAFKRVKKSLLFLKITGDLCITLTGYDKSRKQIEVFPKNYMELPFYKIKKWEHPIALIRITKKNGNFQNDDGEFPTSSLSNRNKILRVLVIFQRFCGGLHHSHTSKTIMEQHFQNKAGSSPYHI